MHFPVQPSDHRIVIHTVTSECPPDIHALLEELRSMEDRVFPSTEHTLLINWLTQFFFPAESKNFMPIEKSKLLDAPLLFQKTGKLPMPLQWLLIDLRGVKGNAHPENHDSKSLYMTLNFLMRPICKKLKPSKKPLKPTYWE